MAGHSKWANIKHKKGRADAARGKLFSKLIREITVAARLHGGVAEDNPRLRAAVDNALTAKVGETVLFIHSQANRDTRPHLIGGHGDYVWERGSFNDPPQTNLETWFIAGGSAGAALYKFMQPGLYVYLNHNLIDAVLKGAAAHVKVEGEWNNDLLEQIKKPSPIE